MYHALIFTGISRGPIVYYRPLGAYRIRTELESHGYSVKVIDFFQYLTDSDIERAFEKYVSKETLWVGFSTTFFDCDALLDTKEEFYQRLKEKYNVKIVMGGSKARQGKFKFADYFITGHGDNAVVALTDYLSQKNTDLIFKEEFEKIIIDGNKDYDRKDLSKIDVVWKDEDRLSNYFTLPIELSRGCIFKCAFCQFPFTGKKKFDYVRDKDNIRDEFIRNYEQFGITSYQFMDDTYNDSMVKLEYMHNLITNLPFKIKFDAYIKPELLVRWPDQIPLLAETGIRGASMGVESFNPKTRAAIQKMPDINKILNAMKDLKTRTNGQAKIQMNLISGLPHESEESMFQTQKFVLECEYIDYWIWWPLQILDKNSAEYLSPIEKNPKSFGYEVSIPITTNFKNLAQHNSVQPLSVYWKNDFIDVIRATELAKKFNEESKTKIKLGGWLAGAIEGIGIDIEDHYQKTKGYRAALPIDSIAKKITDFIDEYIKYNVRD